MKVLHIWFDLVYGGVQTMLVNIANEQISQGLEVSILTMTDEIDSSLLNSLDRKVKVLQAHRKIHSKNPLFLFRMNRLIKKENPDIIHLHRAEIKDLIFSRRLQKIMCSTVHDIPFGEIRLKGRIYKDFPRLNYVRMLGRGSYVTNLDKISHIFAISQAVHDELLKNYGLESRVVCNGILTKEFKQKTTRFSNGVVRLVQVSRLLHSKKGQDMLIQAVAKLQGKAIVDFIGIGDSMDYLKNLAKELHSEEWVRFLGNKTQAYLKEHLSEYDLFVQPSRYEGFGLTVAEAMAAGVPVLVSAGQGPAEVTCGDKYGWTFENGNMEELTRMINYIMEHFDEALNKAELAVEHVRDTYDVSVTAKKYIEEYMRITETNSVNKCYRGGAKLGKSFIINSLWLRNTVKS